jgi:hypothetical protein
MADDGITEYQGKQIIRLLESILSELQEANSHLSGAERNIDRMDTTLTNLAIDVAHK